MMGVPSGVSSASHTVAQRVDDMGQFESFASELRRRGHSLKIIVRSGSQVRAVVLAAAKREWQYAKRAAPFSADQVQGLRETLNSIDDDGTYYYGFVLIYAWATHMLQNGVYCAAYDFAHCNVGTLASITMVNGNRNVVPIVHAHYADNENGATSDATVQEAVAQCPALNGAGITVIRDGNASLEHSLSTYLPRAHQYSCVKHAKPAAGHSVKGGGGQAAVMSQYSALVHATNERQFVRAQDEASASLKTYVDRSRDPDSRRFLHPFAAAGGKLPASLPHPGGMPFPRTTSAFGEKMNNLNQQNDARTAVSPLQLLRTLVESDVGRLEKNKAAATACSDVVPPGVRALLAQLMSVVHNPQPDFIIKAMGQKSYKYIIKSSHSVESRRAYELVKCEGPPTTWTCTCGHTKITNFPCVHMAAVGIKMMGLTDPAQLVAPEYTTVVWQQQLSFDFAATLPASIPDGPASGMRPPVWLPRKAGRPKKKRIPSAGESSGSNPKRPRLASRLPLAGTPASPLSLESTPAAEIDGEASASAVPRAPKQYMCRKCGQPRRGCGCKNAAYAGGRRAPAIPAGSE